MLWFIHIPMFLFFIAGITAMVYVAIEEDSAPTAPFAVGIVGSVILAICYIVFIAAGVGYPDPPACIDQLSPAALEAIRALLNG